MTDYTPDPTRINEDGDEVPSIAYWKTITEEDLEEILFVQGGWLTPEQCEDLWCIEKRPGKPPQRLHVAVRRETRQ
jgi:hypothetical protein